MWIRIISTVWLLGVAPASAADFGEPLDGLTPAEIAAFEEGVDEFEEVETIEEGLGPVFNGRSCVGCHNVPAVGGDSAAKVTRFGTKDGKKFDDLSADGGSLIQKNGIGLVGDCNYVGEVIPPTATIVALRKTPFVFGLGFIEAIRDSDIHQGAAKQPKEIKGKVHMVKDRGQPSRPGRFGVKNQVATLEQFSGDAYLNEMGITSPKFPLENCPNGDCALLRCDPVLDPEDNGDDVLAFTVFMRLLAAPPRGDITPEVLRGEQVFATTGCAGCHTPSWTAGSSPVAAISGKTFHPYSDFLLHEVNGDGIEQGKASGAEMRTAPLWGLRAKTALLHDGRTTSVTEAIEAHDGQGAASRDAFRRLSAEDLAALLAFLASL